MVCSWEWKNDNGADSSLQPSDELTCLYFESDGMPLIKPTYVVFLVEWLLWEPVQWTASAHILGKWSPLSPILCPFIYHFLSPLHRLSGCVNNESIFGGGGLFDCRWGEEVTGMHGFHSLSIGPCALNNSLTYHFFSWDWKKWWQILLFDNRIDHTFSGLTDI